jgi:hypothetical protein
MKKYNLFLNKKKSQILAPKQITNAWKKKGIKDIGGIEYMNQVKYLGITVGFNKDEMKK